MISGIVHYEEFRATYMVFNQIPITQSGTISIIKSIIQNVKNIGYIDGNKS